MEGKRIKGQVKYHLESKQTVDLKRQQEKQGDHR